VYPRTTVRTLAVVVIALLLPAVAWADGRTVDLGGGVSLELVEIPAGKLSQGSALGSPGHADDETAREVTLSKAFLIGKTPVTVAQFERFTAETNYRTEAEKGTSGGFGWNGSDLVQAKQYNWKNPGYASTPTHPVTIVTFADAEAFDAWLGQRIGMAVRLPTEAEYEYAAHGNRPGRFAWGDDPNAAEANAWFAKNARDGARPVGQRPANGFGLHDTAGNVWEWCVDWYMPIGPQAVTDPRVDAFSVWPKSDKPRRVLKGGSWRTDDREKLRPAARYRATEGSRNADFGFRVVAIPGSKPAPAPAITPTAPRKIELPQPNLPPSDPPKNEGSPSGSSGCGNVGFGVFAAVTVAFIAFIALLSRLMRRTVGSPARRPSSGSPFRVRVAADGFWIDAPPGASSGQQIPYKARVHGKVVNGSARLSGSPNGTFVYTGGVPSDVSVADLWAAEQVTAPIARSVVDDSHSYSSSSSSTSTGWPSAY
jgi:sulfatase modifying factor 1